MEIIQLLKEKSKESIGIIRGFLFSFRSKTNGDYRITIFTISFMLVMVVLSLHFFSNIFVRSNPKIEKKSCVVCNDAPLIGENIHDTICVVKKGEQVMMLGKSSIYVLVDLSSGERGLIDVNNFDKEIQEMWAPDVPIKALGLRKAACKQLLFEGKIYVTTDWMEKKFAKGTPFKKISDEYYGFAETIDKHDDGSMDVIYPYEVKDFDARKKYYGGVKVRYVDGMVESYEYLSTTSLWAKVSKIETWVLFTRKLAGTDLVTRIRSTSFFSSSGSYNSIENLHSDKKETLAKKEMPKIIRVPIAWITFLFEAVLVILMFGSVLLLPVILAHYVCYVKSLSNFMCGLIMFIVFCLNAIFVITVFIPYSACIILMLILTLIVFNNILYWLNHHRCDKCKNMYTINFVGESGHKVGITTKIRTRTVTYASGRTDVSKEVDETANISFTEHYECVFCGEKTNDNIYQSTSGIVGRKFAEKHGLKFKDNN